MNVTEYQQTQVSIKKYNHQLYFCRNLWIAKKELKKKLFQRIIFSKNMLKFSKAALSMYIWIAFEF